MLGVNASPETTALVMLLESKPSSPAFSRIILRKEGVPVYAVGFKCAIVCAWSSVCPTPAGKTQQPKACAPPSSIHAPGVK